MRRLAGLLCLFPVIGCYDGPDDGQDTVGSATFTTTTETATAGTDGTDSGATTTDTGGTDTSATTDTSTATATASTTGGTDTGNTTGTTGGPDLSVCDRWNADRADLSEGTWSGSVNGCDPGDISADGRANALKNMNLYRFIADLPPVTTSDDRNQKAQACALIMHAAGMLEHNPPMSWNCWTADGDDGAGSSNISPTPGVEAVDLYMVDPGNPTTMGHRRWILSNSIGPTGLGSTDSYSCMWTVGGQNDAGKMWTAWPAPGTFPLEAVQPSWSSIDETGWTIQSDDLELGGATVTITKDGQDLPVTVTSLQGGYGSSSAISMIPQGWTTTEGTYHVEVTGVGSPITYDVDVVACSG